MVDVRKCFYFFVLSLFFLKPQCSKAQQGNWVTYEGGQGPGNGKTIVLVSGDEEYRSEEALPQLAHILSAHHGFKTTVLFSIDPETGQVNPNDQTNIPGLKNLETADLMVIFTRFRELPDQQMKYIDEYIQAGKPIVGMRTATHAFSYGENSKSPYAKYSYNSKVKGWEGGFGRQILGETWIDHHGIHGEEGTRGLIDGIMERKGHPILKGVNDIWGPTDVYGTRDLTGNPKVLVWGQSTNGMTPSSELRWEKSIMPIAWTRKYTSEHGNTGRVFTTTMGASVDLKSEGLRRLLVNACYWTLGIEDLIPVKSNVTVVGDYQPTMFGFDKYLKGLTPTDFK